ncbi:MAG TPA: AtpZ/AtpI family protein [Gemmatimonadales bacterium]|nr:AtpZ/AtpI family protein [Gemmatimonadales bacterium]
MPPERQDGSRRGYARGYEYFAMALSFAIAILLFGAGGWFLDGWLHTRPLFAILGAFLGGFAGFMRIYYRVKSDTAQNGAEKRGK